MSLWHCQSCTTIYAVGLGCCPHCGASDHMEDGMAKISRNAGSSNGIPPAAETTEAEPAAELTEPEIVAAPAAEQAATISEYETWFLRDLRGECERRNLPAGGNKDELVARLAASDKG